MLESLENSRKFMDFLIEDVRALIYIQKKKADTTLISLFKHSIYK